MGGVAALLHLVLLAQQTTTTEVRRIVGDPLPKWVVLGAGAALLVVILLAGVLVRRRSRVPS
jgi:hypothetical protein